MGIRHTLLSLNLRSGKDPSELALGPPPTGGTGQPHECDLLLTVCLSDLPAALGRRHSV